MGRSPPSIMEQLMGSTWEKLQAGSPCSPRRARARAQGCSSSKVPFHPGTAAESRSLPGCPLTPPKDKEFGGLTQCSELPSLLAGTL